MMNEFTLWLLAGLAVCLVAGLLGYRAFRRAAERRKALRAAADEALRQQARRKAAAEEAARVVAAKRAEAEAARANAEAMRVVEGRRAADAARAEATRVAAAEAAARATAQRLAAEAAARARVAAAAAAAAAAAREAARIAAERAVAPVRPVAPAPPVAPIPPRKTRDQTLVMVADDSKIVRVKTGRLLEQHRYRVTYALDGLDAAQQLESNMPDVVITDVEMPGMDGFELTRQVRQNPSTAHIPVIMITAAEDKHREDAERAGVSMLLGKPYPQSMDFATLRPRAA